MTDKCYLCFRINPLKIIEVIKELWDNIEIRTKILEDSKEYIEYAYNTKPYAFCGRTERFIISGLIYLLGYKYGDKRTQAEITEAYSNYITTDICIRNSYNKWLEDFPELFKGIPLHKINYRKWKWF
jgi:hypothetical protein